MNPITLTQNLERSLISYLSTTFDVNRDGKEPELAEALRRSFETRGSLFKGPFLELAPPYVTGSSLQDLIGEGILSPGITKFSWPIQSHQPLYRHQELAIRRLCAEGRNVVISSGTGSGKTESFLIPILNDLIIDDTPGVRAILIYPMNALVNDQLERLRFLLKNSSITFGRYTSELHQTEHDAERWLDYEPLPNEIVSRERIRDGETPNILITNYAMLEYLLLRPEDSPLFVQKGQRHGAWRFLTLDEAHTYNGAAGVEVSMLLRRLRHRLKLQLGEMQCIATSATLINEDKSAAVEFAQQLFGEAFEEDDIILGEVNHEYLAQDDTPFAPDEDKYLQTQVSSAINSIRSDNSDSMGDVAFGLAEAGVIPDDLFDRFDEYESFSSFLWDALQNNAHIHKLRKWMEDQSRAITVEEAADYLFTHSDPLERLQALYHLIELGSIARVSLDKPPLLPVRYHLFARSPNGIWACLNPQCQGRAENSNTKWSRLFSVARKHCDLCGCAVYPITICRTCGQVYIRMYEYSRAYLEAERNEFDERAEKRYFTWLEVIENTALADENEEEELLDLGKTVAAAKMTQESKIICLKCQHYASRCQCEDGGIHITLYQVSEKQTQKGQTRTVPLEFMHQCYRCQDKPYIRDSEIVTTLDMGNNNPLGILIQTLYKQIPTSSNPKIQAQPGGGRKMLTFSDSRQGAARFAAHLQDIVNKQQYRHVIVDALRQWDANREHNPRYDYAPDVTALSDFATQLAWEKYQIFQNDQFIADVNRQNPHLSRAEQNRLQGILEREIIAEFTVRRRERQSLENLGLIAVRYFEEENEPDFTGLAEALDIQVDQTQTLVKYFLDVLRREKVINLPQSVKADDEVFGRNKISPHLVRKSNNKSGEVAWIGKTNRHGRRRLMAKLLKDLHKPFDDESVENALIYVWEWLVSDETNLMVGNATSGYQLNYNRLFFYSSAEWYQCSQCQTVSCRDDLLICPNRDCHGRYERIEVEHQFSQNYFYNLFGGELVPMRVEEHSAQLSPTRGRDYQNLFKDGRINLLSCSTTFEMGIDLGDLQSVVMNNVPPTVANYRQRSGRAGRRASGTAFIMTWAASDRPHDQSYYTDPSRIISGQVRVPMLLIENLQIRRRHMNAILLGDFLRYCQLAGRESLRDLGTFFDSQAVSEPHYSILEKWLELQFDHLLLILEEYSELFEDSPSQQDLINWLESFVSDMREAFEFYEARSNYYKLEQDRLSRQTPPDYDEAKRYHQLLERLRGEDIIEYLSNRSVLPSYSFPLSTVELLVPPDKRDKLRLQRDLRQAIFEYAPGASVVADKQIWRSQGLIFHRRTARTNFYRVCDQCHHIEISSGEGIPFSDAECKVCGKSNLKPKRYVTPDGFKADWRDVRIAGQYVERPYQLRQSGLLVENIPAEESPFENLHFAYQADGKLLYINEKRGRGFYICLNCGNELGPKDKKCKNKGCDNAQVDFLSLGHTVQTDTLHIRFSSTSQVPVPRPEDSSFWLSLLYALLQSASRELDIERRDIDGVLVPRQIEDGWVQTIALFDTVPGGAGHVGLIKQRFPEVIAGALSVVNCTNCTPETSCYHCLRDYGNQFFHNILIRQKVVRFLEALQVSLNQADSNLPMGSGYVSTLSPIRWLFQQCGQARQSLHIAVNSINRGIPHGENTSWLDLLQNLGLQGVQVNLYLTELPNLHEPEGQSIAEHLRLLVNEYGLALWYIEELPYWHIMIDPHYDDSQRVIRLQDMPISLGEKTASHNRIITSIDLDLVDGAHSEFNILSASEILPLHLQPPANVRVINISYQAGKPKLSSQQQKISPEAQLFEEHSIDVFRHPVRELRINDRYLLDEERLVKRVGAYIELANQHGQLQYVQIKTNAAGQGATSGTREEQNRAIEKLKRQFGGLEIEVTRKEAEHDRYIQIIRVDGTLARILIGKGLDFVRSDGYIEPTYLVIEDPYE